MIRLTHLEAESIHIMREVAAEVDAPPQAPLVVMRVLSDWGR